MESTAPATPPARRVRRRTALSAGLALSAGTGVGLWQLRGEDAPPAATPTGAFAAIDGLTLAFTDHFTDARTIDVFADSDNTVKWYTDLPFGWGKVPASDLAVADSVLTIDPAQHQNWSLATITPDGTGRDFGRGYFEARMRFPTRGNQQGWPAFWSLSSHHITDLERKRWMEIDFFEGMDVGFPARFHGTVHQWATDGTVDHIQSDPNSALISASFSDWNTYGALWEQGRVTWYFNRRKVLAASFSSDVPRSGESPAKFSELNQDDQRMAVILGSGLGWPLEVDWVSVWQASAG